MHVILALWMVLAIVLYIAKALWFDPSVRARVATLRLTARAHWKLLILGFTVANTAILGDLGAIQRTPDNPAHPWFDKS
jgi:hypothetical protein